VLLLILDRRYRLRGGRLFWVYAAYYTAGRVWIEALRIDAAQQVTLLGVTARLNVWTSILVFVAAVLVFVTLTAHRAREPAGVTHDAGKAMLIQHPDVTVSEYGDRGNVATHRAGLDEPRPASQDATASAKDDGK
jgi:hypothetical protein